MKLVVALFGAAILLGGACGTLSPRHIVALVRWESQRGVWIAAGIRFTLGAVLLLAAPQIRHPELGRLFGTVALLGGVGTVLIGPHRFESFVEWWSRQPAWLLRISSAFAGGFGALLLWLSNP